MKLYNVFVSYPRQKEPLHSESDTTSRTQPAVDAARFHFTSRKKLALLADIPPRKCVNTTGERRLKVVARRVLDVCAT